ncbi:alpha/beta fold hydrolase [Mycobacterium sp. UM_CSW]|uniref:esterase/lipase family protein n=1 Tax=Mycobacterium sp. UM_CSW TaxID=1370119 RepID=UPI00083709C4|nr:alpha/beta fold hydrolase [Mycobacterium sp. UM_CSW]
MVQAQPTVRQLTRGLGGARTAFQTAVRVAKVQAREVALMLSVPATAPVRLIRGDYETANAVESQPPARASAQPPVLLVHGFGGGKSSWSSVAQALRARGLSVDAMAYAPAGNSVEQLAGRLVDHVQTMLFSTGAAKVHLVGHSLGGVIIAQAISDPRLRGRVDTVITLGSPFGGSPWADALPVVDMVRALRAGSPLLSRLASTPLPEGVRWLSVTAALDIVVPGLRSVPPHPQAKTVTISGVGHLGMLLSPHVIRYITAALCAEPSATDAEPAVLQNAS